jgi:3-oxoacyl-[acyl-carrier-protein] synthase-3
LQNKLGIKNSGAAFDMQAVCSGFAYAVAMADSFIRSGQHNHRAGDRRGNLLAPARFQRPHHLRAVRRRRRRRDPLKPPEQPGVLASALHADGSHANILCTPGNVNGGVIAGSAFLYMDGQAVFKLAVNVLEKVAVEALEKPPHSGDRSIG